MPSTCAAALISLLLLAGRPAGTESEPEHEYTPEQTAVEDRGNPVGRDYATGLSEKPAPSASPTPFPAQSSTDPSSFPEQTPLAPRSDARPRADDVSDKQAALRPSTSRYRIGPDDAIRVQVVGHKEFDTTATVSERRTILLPVVGEVDVADLTIEELRNRLVSTYKNGYLRSPQVVVDIVDYNNMKVWVFGFVNSPGERRLTGPTTLMSLLSLVGNAKSSAGSTVTIERTNTTMAQSPTGGLMPVSESDTITVDLNLLLRDGDLSQDVDLQNGDKIYVPPTSSKVYALGEVVKPGFYPYREGMQISDLIQLAGGLTEFANPKKVKIRRDGLPNPLQVNYKAFVKDGDVEHNVPLMDGDRVIINSSFLF